MATISTLNKTDTPRRFDREEDAGVMASGVILVVDGQQEIGAPPYSWLQREHYTLHHAKTGAEALALLGNADIVLFSGALDDIDGVDFCQNIAIHEGKRPPVILLVSPDSDYAALNRLFDAGVIDDYMTNPVHPQLLCRRVCQILELCQLQEERRLRKNYQILGSLTGIYLYEAEVLQDGRVAVWLGGNPEHAGVAQVQELSDWLALVYPQDSEIVTDHKKTLFDGHRHVAEFRVYGADQALTWVRNHAFPVFDRRQRVRYIYGVAQDMTAFKENEERLQRQALELQERNEDLDAFARSVAHDLKSPISSMMGFASLVRKYYDRMGDQAILEYIDLVIDEGYKLKEMINSLLVLAGVNKMKQADMTMLNMPVIIENVQRRLTMMIIENQAKITLPEQWPTAIGYAPWVEEIWMNYLSNAIKYGGRPPVIELGGECAQGVSRFWVRDNGDGLTPEQQGRIFIPFTRLNQINVEGHGLGLSVVQRIVERLGGSVGIQSTVGEGSVFSFTLPAFRSSSVQSA